MKTPIEIMRIIAGAGASSATDALDVLRDGTALAQLGIADEDQESVEYCHDQILAHLENSIRLVKDGY